MSDETTANNFIDEAAVRRAVEKIAAYDNDDLETCGEDTCDWYCEHWKARVAEIISTELASDSGKAEK